MEDYAAISEVIFLNHTSFPPLMVIEYLPLVLALLLSVTYYWGCRIDIKHHMSKAARLKSFSAGVFITYILLELFPLFAERAQNHGKMIFAAVLVGFVLHHFIEGELYANSSRAKVGRRLVIEEESVSFLYYFVLGIILVSFVQENAREGVLFFIPLLLHVLINTLATDPHISKAKTAFFAASSFVGAVFAMFFWVDRPLWLESTLLGLAVGTLLYTIVRHQIPYGREEKVSYFLLGFVFYSLVLMISWNV
jgi:hypothetical protein